jgi:hypothetical protein
MIRILILISPLLLTACLAQDDPPPRPVALKEHAPGYVRPSDAAAISAAKAALTKTLKDPGSAQFTDVVRTSSVGVDYVCGKVKARNSYGGYTIPKGFLYQVADNKLITDESMGEVVRAICETT